MVVGTCKLCLKELPLLNKSHIIPEFMYDGMYNQFNKLFRFSPVAVAEGNGKIQNPSKGEYESGILCKKCDGELLSSFESYGKFIAAPGDRTSKHPILKDVQIEKGYKISRISNFDYTKYKLLILSILWRSSISNRPFFKEISLGSHEERIRKMILNLDAGAYDEYPIVFGSFANDPKMPDNFVATPITVKTKEGLRICIIIAGGMVYFIFVGMEHKSIPKEILDSTIKPDNTVSVIQFPDGEGWRFILRYFGIQK